MNINIEKLTLREVNSLLLAAEQRKKLISIRRPIALVRRQVTALIVEHGYTINELYCGQPLPETTGKKGASRRKTSKVAAKYRDPENPRDTWSGRGRMPRWLAKKIRFGRHATDFLIPGLAKPTPSKTSSIGKRTLVKQK